MKKSENNNNLLWGGVTGGVGAAAVFLAAGNLPVALVSGAAMFAAGAVLFKKRKQPQQAVTPEPDGPSLLEKGQEGVKLMHALASVIDDEKVRKNADEVVQLCDTIIGMVTNDPRKLQKSTKLFTYYIPTINKTLEIYRKLETADNNREAYDITNRFLDDCEDGMKKHIANLSRADLTDMSVEMETMTNVMKIDGLVNHMNPNAALPKQQK